MTFFKVWGWVHLAACIVSAVSIFVRAFISDEGTGRAAAALVFPLACVSAWWVWIALHLAR